MSVMRVVLGVVMASLVSGCAGLGARQEFARLQSQVSLLDDRVAQLERTSVGHVSASSLGYPPLEAESTAPGGTVVVPSAGTASSATRAVAKSSGKPTTSEIQQALRNAGFYQGAIDGKMGPKTRSAIHEFQRVHGLPDDGIAGKQTWSKLRAYADLSGTTTELSAAEILK